MNTTLISVGLLFFLNPCVWLWDVLPDFIGAFLIMLGMKKIIFLDADTEGVYRKLWRVALLSAAKIGVSVLFAGAAEGLDLLLSTSFVVLELIILIPAMSAVLRMLDSFQTRYCDTNSTIPESKFSKVSVIIAVYSTFRLIIGILPETTILLSGSKYGDVVSGDGRYYPSDSKWALYILAAGICTIFFVIVLVVMFRAFSKYRKDKATPVAVVEAAEKKKAEDVARWHAKKWAIVRIPFVASAALSIFLFIDGVDYLPKVIASLVIASLSLMYANGVFERILSVVTNLLLAASSVLSNMRLAAFFNEYHDETVLVWNDEALAEYRTITVLLIIEAALLFASLMLMTEIIIRAKKRQSEECHITEKEMKRLKRGMLKYRIAFSVSSLAAAAFPLIRPEIPGLAMVLVTATGIAAAIVSALVELDIFQASSGIADDLAQGALNYMRAKNIRKR